MIGGVEKPILPPFYKKEEVMSVELIAILLSSPVIIGVIQGVFQMLSNKKSLEEIRKSLDNYKVEQAIQDLRQKNWRILESGSTRKYSNQEWHMLYNNLTRLIPFDSFSDELKEEIREVKRILRGEKND